MPAKKDIFSQQSQEKPRGKRPDESGGETITVEITVNGKRKYQRSATITGDNTNQQIRRYTLDDGTEIMHNRSLGIKKLAENILKR